MGGPAVYSARQHLDQGEPEWVLDKSMYRFIADRGVYSKYVNTIWKYNVPLQQQRSLFSQTS